jgi:putative membrane protein
VTAFHDITPLLAGSGGGHEGFWLFPFGFLWLVLVGTVIWLALRTAWRERTGGDRAREILAERYASGEISRDEYRERLAELQ